MHRMVSQLAHKGIIGATIYQGKKRKQFATGGIFRQYMLFRQCVLYVEMDESLVGFPGFKPVCEVLTPPWVGSIPTHLRQMIGRHNLAKMED